MHWFEEKNAEAHIFIKKGLFSKADLPTAERFEANNLQKVLKGVQIHTNCTWSWSLLSKITQQYLFNALQNVIYHLKGRGSRQNTSQPEYQTRAARVMGEKFGGDLE